MGDVIKVGCIGAGSHANKAHYPSLAAIKDVELVAICDLDEGRLKSTADRYSVEYRFRDYKEMINSVKLDAVYVIMAPVPVGFYKFSEPLVKIVLECLRYGLHVFIEKPPGVSSSETRMMAEAAKKYGCKSMVGFNRRFIPIVREVKHIVENYGEITHCIAVFHKNALNEGEPWGCISHLVADVIHAVDTLRFMCGEPERVASYVTSFYTGYPNSFHALVKFRNGSIGHLCSNYSSGSRIHYFEIHSKGIYALIDIPLDPPEKQLAIILKNNKPYGEPEVIRNLDLVGNVREYHVLYGFLQENIHFIDCIKNDLEPETNFEDAVKTMEFVELIASSTLGGAAP
jgi:virulence factor